MQQVLILFLNLLCVGEIVLEAVPLEAEISTPATPPTCNDGGRFPAEDCSEYYECEGFLMWWNAVLKQCPDGKTFDSSTNECTDYELSNCQGATNITTVTTPASTTSPIPTTTLTDTSTPIPTTNITSLPSAYDNSVATTTPSCSYSVKYPSRFEDKYYECILVWFEWRLYLLSCPEGEIFDKLLLKCVLTIPLPPGTLPTCIEAGKFAGLEENQYYECKYAWLKWNLYQVTCPLGQIFNQTLESCVPTSDVPSDCSESGIYPGPQVNQYYECKYAWLKWNLYLVTCPDGQVFNQTLNECVSLEEVPPNCNAAGKYPAVLENQYYECLYAWFQWRAYLGTCPLGDIFDQNDKECAPIA